MKMPQITNLLRTLAGVLGFILLLVLAAPLPAEDAVILNDGFTIRGKAFKEKVVNFDALSGPQVFHRLNAFDGVDQGAKYVFFSGHSKKQLAGIEKDLPKESTLEFTKPNPGSRNLRIPGLADLTYSNFDANWRRKILAKLPDGKTDTIEQLITYLSPSKIYITSISHSWRQAYSTQEFDPKVIKQLLLDHPKVKDVNGKPDLLRRLLIPEFFKDVGWLPLARTELEDLKKQFPGPWERAAQEKYAEVEQALEEELTRWTIKELELAVNAGRYDVASAYLRDYKPKSPNARDLAKLAELKAKVELLQPRFALAQQLLRDLIDQQTGGDIRNAFRATLGVPLATTWLLPPPNPELAPLLTAAETILPEFHPDSLGRIEFFIDLAEQAESRRKAGKEPSNKPEQLLALAITGWLKGKNGAEKDLKNAIRCWNTRQFAIQHLKEEGENKRAIELRKYLAGPDKLPADELSQIISLLPPIEAEDLSQISNQARDPKLTEGIANIVVRKTPNTPAAGNISYAFRLPPEYHHGRPYPLIIILTQPGIPVEKLVAGLAPDAAKNGYILAGLEWGDRGNRAYDYSGDHHADVQALIREMSRKFMIDPDKVFLFGYLDGANFALDMGVSHPDLFAGVVAMGPNIIGSFYGEYWKNAQKLPVYSVVGEISGTAFSNLRTVYERWLPLGFPGLMTIYKGRGNEWFASEIGTIFDWMNRKSRARGTSSLRLNDVRFEAWQSMRYSDQRFYWIEFNTINPVNTLKPNRPNYPPYPAQIRADIKKGNEIVLSDIRGVKQLTIYLERDMIDWTSKVSITVPGAKKKWTPQELTPDPGVMFEHLYRTGDRKMLFFGKVEFELY